jgi:cytochrome c-type biogenesis protein CcmH/NrfF
VRRLVLALAAAAFLALPAAAAACPKTTLGDVEDEVMCPVCGVPLELATEAPQANRERAFIERQIAACRSKGEIKRALAAQFGDDVLSLPDDEGFDLAAYVVPAGAVALGLVLVALAIRRWRRGRPSTPSAPAAAGPTPDPRDAARLDEDLRRYDL